MKAVKQIMLVVLGLFFFALQGCSHDDYIPVPGPAGADGTNGSNGINGTTTCESCHSKSHTDPIKASYKLSVHGMETLHLDSASGLTLTTSEYTNRTGCVQCHVGQGYIDKMNGTPLATGLGLPTNPAYPVGAIGASSDHVTAINCATCHEKHSSFNFVADGNDFALRQGFTPVVLDQDKSYSIDMGTSNTCVNCHQPRGLPPTTGDVKLSNRFGPHHGPQSTLLEGIQGALIVGSTAYPAPKSAKHRSGASCVACHMGKGTDATNGAHTWKPTPNACTTCHTGGAPASVTGFAADMATLQALLVAKGAYSTTTNAFTSNTVPIKVAQAAWNYSLLLEDRSNGVHNPTYAKALLKNSIEALK
jgi:protein-arginine kinase activator protein McsA